MQLEGRKAIVTGGGSGIGRAVAHRFAQEGASIAIVDLDRDRAEQVQGEIGNDRAAAVVADIADPDQAVKAMEDAQARLGRADILVNNAAVPPADDLLEIDVVGWDRDFSVTLRGAYT